MLKPSELRTIWRKYAFTPSKARGQNYLIDEGALQAIFAEMPPPGNQPVLEIGPGFGAVTETVYERYSRAAAIEVDPLAVRYLRATFPERPGWLLLHEDATRQDVLYQALQHLGASETNPVFVVGNLPYSVGTSILLNLFPYAKMLSGGVFLLQTDVGQRLLAQTPSKERTYMTVMRELHAAAKSLRKLSPHSFFPTPTIDSVLLRLDFHAPKLEVADEWPGFDRFLKMAFSQKRKKLRNCLPPSAVKQVSLEAEALLEQRAETLEVHDFLALWQEVRVFHPFDWAVLSETARPSEFHLG